VGIELDEYYLKEAAARLKKAQGPREDLEKKRAD
jgi:hypothetical protein